MIKRTKSIRAVEALEAVKKRINIELERIDVESNWSGPVVYKNVKEKVLEIIDEQLEKEA